jgi:hypothetical protein
MAQQEIHGPLAVLQRQGVRCRPIDVVGQPRRRAGHRGPRTRQSGGGHGHQGQVVGGRAAGLRHLRAQQRADASLFPEGAGGLEHALRRALRNDVEADIRREYAGRPIDPLVVGHAQQALGQSAQGLRIDVVGTADRRNAPGLRASAGLMVVIVRQRVIEGVGTVLALLSRGTSIHAYKATVV